MYIESLIFQFIDSCLHVLCRKPPDHQEVIFNHSYTEFVSNFQFRKSLIHILHVEIKIIIIIIIIITIIIIIIIIIIILLLFWFAVVLLFTHARMFLLVFIIYQWDQNMERSFKNEVATAAREYCAKAQCYPEQSR